MRYYARYKSLSAMSILYPHDLASPGTPSRWISLLLVLSLCLPVGYGLIQGQEIVLILTEVVDQLPENDPMENPEIHGPEAHSITGHCDGLYAAATPGSTGLRRQVISEHSQLPVVPPPES